MTTEQKNAAQAGMGLIAAGAAWPTVYGGITYALMSPLERAITDSMCGGAPHAAWLFLGHCPTCWWGAAALFAAGGLLLAASRLARPAPVRA